MRNQKKTPEQKKLRRRIAVGAIVVAVLIGAVAGGTALYKKFNGTKINVYAVADLNMGDYGDSSAVTGTITKGAAQDITLDADKEVAKVYVKDGQEVKKGQKLFKYDNTLSKLELEQSKLDLQSVELKIKTLNDQIAHPKKYLKEEYELEYDDSSEDTDDTSSESAKETDDADDTDDSASAKTETPEIEITQTDIDEYVADKKSELQEAELERSKSELEVAKQEKQVKALTVKSTMAGVVTVNDTSSATYMTVQAEQGLYISGTLNEYLLNQVEVGDTLDGEDYYTGETFTAQIESISEFPTDSGSESYDYDTVGTNVSYYSFTAAVVEDIDATVGDEVSLTFQEETDESSVMIEKAFVLDENSKNYVYINDSGRLKKQEVELGKTMDGTIVEVTSGLSDDDYIAFPYGNNVKDGVKTEKAEIDQLYE